MYNKKKLRLGLSTAGLYLAQTQTKMKTVTSKLPAGSVIVLQEVNRTLSSRQSLEVTKHGSWLSINPHTKIHETPSGKENIVELVFIPLISTEIRSAQKLQRILGSFGLDPDPRAQAAYNGGNPDFADSHPNLTIWLGEDGKFYNQRFYQYGFDDPQRTAEVGLHKSETYNGWWICGSRKVNQQSLLNFSVGRLGQQKKMRS